MFRLIFYIAASIIMTFINLPFNYTNAFELVWGNILTSLILSTLNFCFYLIVYKFVRWYALLADATSEDKSRLHWFIRLVFALSLYALTYIPGLSELLTGIIHSSYLFGVGKWNEFIQRISDILTFS